MSLLHVGLIGVGLMGHGIAINLVRAGYNLTFLDHAGNQPTEDLRTGGAKSGATPAEVVRAADVIILCVTGSPEVADVLSGADGVLSALHDNQILVDCSTAIPSETLKNASAVRETGAVFLDAPMTRTPREAAEGRLNLIVGGDAQTLDICRPIFDVIAENVYHAGAIGSGHAMKLLHNFVSLGFSAVLAEAAARSLDEGIAPDVLIQILGEGGGGGTVLDRMAPFIRNGDVAGFQFSIANALKDMSYYVTMAEQTGARHEVAHAVRSLYRQAADTADTETPLPEIIDYLRRDTEVDG